MLSESLLKMWDRFIVQDPYGRIPDIARYHILAECGGFYVDTDVEPLRSYEPLVGEERAVIGWEDEKCCSTAVLGASAHHPAIEALIETLPAWQAKHDGTNPVLETGPMYATAHWRHRDDVLRLPPIAFYPVHWKEMPDLAPPYPEGSFSVHHWASGWKTAKEKRHVQDIALLVKPGQHTDWIRDLYACYLPEGQFVAAEQGLEAAQGEYVVELGQDVFVPVNTIRRSTLELQMARRPIWFEAHGVLQLAEPSWQGPFQGTWRPQPDAARIWRRSLGRAAPTPLEPVYAL